MALSYAIVYGVYVSIGTAMSNMLNPFGYTPTQISIAGGTCLFAGVIAALAVGCVLDSTARYKLTHVMLSAMTLLSTIIVIPALAFGNSSLISLLIPILLLGISSVSFFPTALSYGAELTFPLQPALVNAAMNFLGQVMAFAMMGTATLITDVDASQLNAIETEDSIKERQSSSYTVIAIMITLLLMNMVLSACVREDLRRINYDKMHQSEVALGSSVQPL